MNNRMLFIKSPFAARAAHFIGQGSPLSVEFNEVFLAEEGSGMTSISQGRTGPRPPVCLM